MSSWITSRTLVYMHVYIRHMYIAVYLRYYVSLLVNINIVYISFFLWVLIETTCPGNTILSCAMLFSTPDPKAQAHYCDHALPIVCRPSVLHFSHFRVLPIKHWTEFNEPWQEARSQRPLTFVIFGLIRKSKMSAPASDWLRYFRLLIWNLWMEFNERGSKISKFSCAHYVALWPLVSKTLWCF